MNLHEYQAKQLLAKYGLKVPAGQVADNPAAAGEIFTQLKMTRGAVKVQVHSGGRGKAGGIKAVNSAAEAVAAAGALLGRTLVTNQSGPAGKPVHQVLVEKSITYIKELYLGAVIDRREGAPVLIASTEGGMEIEEIARTSPDKILKVPLHPHLGLQPYQARELVYDLNICRFQSRLVGSADLFKSGASLFLSFSRMFVENDCSLAEINPLVINKTHGLMALDAKINLDDRGLFRHKDLAAWRDVAQEDPLEYEASKHELSYIGLDGSIGCMVNGAGLAMSTMDLIKLHGGEPANFLDVGGGASTEQVTAAFKLLLANKKVRAVLVNIFGGIMKCDVIAQGIVNAVKEVGLSLPLVVRLEGTNVELGKKILKESQLNIISADTMNEAAENVVRLASGV